MEKQTEYARQHHKLTLVLRILVLLAVIVFLTLGLLNHGFQDVMNKAVRICYECIGIG